MLKAKSKCQSGFTKVTSVKRSPKKRTDWSRWSRICCVTNNPPGLHLTDTLIHCTPASWPLGTWLMRTLSGRMPSPLMRQDKETLTDSQSFHLEVTCSPSPLMSLARTSHMVMANFKVSDHLLLLSFSNKTHFGPGGVAQWWSANP